ncbi:hypothetical protein WUBG_08278 [Wuchereria bancrofti]|uniref:Uncharacterized protein n=1 Tax=Wuchereria bancrofti TaxID=6293 RepID=J9F0B4_WUCBA|nr:hypothetical protein WUBG_08278 [Wuchereria bancrofti]
MTQDYRPLTREKTVSLADCCALYRLKTNLKAMEELLDIQASLDKTVVYEIAKNLEIITETVAANVRDHHLEVNVKQIAVIVNNLPPRYRFPETIHLSPFAKKLLTNAPPSPNEDLFGNFVSNFFRQFPV